MYTAKKTLVDHIGSWIIIGAAGLIPLFFLPLTQDYYDTNKWMLLIACVIIVTVLWTGKTMVANSLSIAWNTTTKALGALAVVSWVSLLVPTVKALIPALDRLPAFPDRTEAFITPFGTATLTALFLLTFLGNPFLDEKSRGTLRWVLYTTASILGLVAIYQFFGLSRIAGLTGIPSLAFLTDPLWTPVGTSIGLMTVLAVTIPLLAGEILHRKKQGHETHMIAAGVMTIACLGGLITTAIQALPLLASNMLPYWAAWQILLENYKNFKQLMVGVGAENFLAAFTAGRPVLLNMTANWSTRYGISSSLVFHIATVYGVFGLAALGSFFVSLIRGKHTVAVRMSRFVALAAFFLLPPSLPAFVFIIFLLMTDTKENDLHGSLLKQPVFTYGLGSIVVLLVLWVSWGFIRIYQGELSFGKSLKALEKREGTAAYNAQIEAITFGPGIARFHTFYSQTNLALASALAGTATSSATPDQVKKDRETATQLVQQAIREAKLAVNLSPNNILVWENIAAVYQELTGVAQGADQWTVAAYQQAMQLDPTNPSLRLRLGGAYVGQQKFDRAAEQYIGAIQLKPDYANAYYNLAFVYRETKKYLAAAQAIREALKYVTPGSESAIQGEQDLAALRELLTEAEKKALDNPESTPAIEPPANPTSAPNTKSAPEPLSPLQ